MSNNNNFMASIIEYAAQNNVQIPASWLEHWNNVFANVALERDVLEVCPACGTESYTRPNVTECPQCGQVYRPWQEGSQIFLAMAKTLNHGWTTNEVLETPRNMTEIKCVSDAFCLFNDWGYNPPLTYNFITFSTRQPWLVDCITHKTSKQIIVARKGNVHLDLTTTTGLPVVKAQFGLNEFNDRRTNAKWYMTLSQFEATQLVGRPDRLMWAAEYAQQLEVEINLYFDRWQNTAAEIAACLPRKEGDNGLTHPDPLWRAIFAEEVKQAE
jgi:hypothetical protein